MSEWEERKHIQLLLDVSRLYYQEDLDQSEIASRVGYSRSQVSRFLSQAREREVVRFVIDHPLDRHIALERELQERFGLRAAHVAGIAEPSFGEDAVACCGMEVLIEACRGATVLAVSAGSMINSVASVLPVVRMPQLQVVPLLGYLTRLNPLTDASSIAQRIAQRVRGTYRELPAPLVAASPRLAQQVKQDEGVATALALASHADVALVGIGGMGERGYWGQIFSGWLSRHDREELKRLGAVGHVFGHHFDAQGRPVPSRIRERIIAVPLHQRSSIKTVIGVAAGKHKTRAIRGALLGSYLDILVTDRDTAENLLQKP